ncbi:hypothetical protein D3C76_262070 [compost metagenome]
MLPGCCVRRALHPCGDALAIVRLPQKGKGTLRCPQTLSEKDDTQVYISRLRTRSLFTVLSVAGERQRLNKVIYNKSSKSYKVWREPNSQEAIDFLIIEALEKHPNKVEKVSLFLDFQPIIGD